MIKDDNGEHTLTYTFRPLVLVSTHSVLLVAVGPIGTGRQARKKNTTNNVLSSHQEASCPTFQLVLSCRLRSATSHPAAAYYNWLRAVTPSTLAVLWFARSDSSFGFGHYAILSSYVVVKNKKAIICDPILFVWNNIGYTFER